MQGTSYYIGIKTILINTIPVILVALLIVAGLWVIPNKMIKGIYCFGKFDYTIGYNIFCDCSF